MKPWELLYHFHRLREHKHFKPRELALYSHLVWTGWEAGRWNGLQVTNERLKVAADCANDQTLDRARNALIQAGLLTYARGKKGHPSRYTLLDPAPDRPKKEKPLQIEGQNAGNGEGQNEGQSGDILRLRIEKEKKISSSGSFADVASLNSATVKSLVDAFDGYNPKGSSGKTQQRIEECLGQGYSPQELLYAFDRADRANAFHWNYIFGVLKGCKGEKAKAGKETSPATSVSQYTQRPPVEMNLQIAAKKMLADAARLKG